MRKNTTNTPLRTSRLIIQHHTDNYLRMGAGSSCFTNETIHSLGRGTAANVLLSPVESQRGPNADTHRTIGSAKSSVLARREESQVGRASPSPSTCEASLNAGSEGGPVLCRSICRSQALNASTCPSSPVPNREETFPRPLSGNNAMAADSDGSVPAREGGGSCSLSINFSATDGGSENIPSFERFVESPPVSRRLSQMTDHPLRGSFATARVHRQPSSDAVQLSFASQHTTSQPMLDDVGTSIGGVVGSHHQVDGEQRLSQREASSSSVDTTSARTPTLRRRNKGGLTPCGSSLLTTSNNTSPTSPVPRGGSLSLNPLASASATANDFSTPPLAPVNPTYLGVPFTGGGGGIHHSRTLSNSQSQRSAIVELGSMEAPPLVPFASDLEHANQTMSGVATLAGSSSANTPKNTTVVPSSIRAEFVARTSKNRSISVLAGEMVGDCGSFATPLNESDLEAHRAQRRLGVSSSFSVRPQPYVSSTSVTTTTVVTTTGEGKSVQGVASPRGSVEAVSFYNPLHIGDGSMLGNLPPIPHQRHHRRTPSDCLWTPLSVHDSPGRSGRSQSDEYCIHSAKAGAANGRSSTPSRRRKAEEQFYSSPFNAQDAFPGVVASAHSPRRNSSRESSSARSSLLDTGSVSGGGISSTSTSSGPAQVQPQYVHHGYVRPQREPSFGSGSSGTTNNTANMTSSAAASPGHMSGSSLRQSTIPSDFDIDTLLFPEHVGKQGPHVAPPPQLQSIFDCSRSDPVIFTRPHPSSAVVTAPQSQRPPPQEGRILHRSLGSVPLHHLGVSMTDAPQVRMMSVSASTPSTYAYSSQQRVIRGAYEVEGRDRRLLRFKETGSQPR